ncbi:MAG: flagellar motor protein MotA [Alphaproteobacteria bacterium]|nr:flagellar motor protein MotA [Alphaproteobacteria bacterium]
MTDTTTATPLEPPRVYLVHMIVFTMVVAILAAILLPGLQSAFLTNPGLNGVIVATLLLGMFHSYRMVGRLFPEVRWLNRFRESEAAADAIRAPRLLGPMATLLRNRQSAVLSPLSMRSLLDSLASRLDESRDLSRYLVGLLIFLGLLGTFWGLLETVTSVGDAIRSLDVTSSQSSTVFEELKAGLERPLAGMGLSFSSSLFGLAGSLILGFLDLKASQAQNRFYNDLEDWLSTITDIAAGDAPAQTGSAPQFLRLELQSLQRSIEKLNQSLDQARTSPGQSTVLPSNGDSIEQLADAVASLVTQMREEQKTVRQWAQSQQTQQNEIQRLLIRATAQTPRPGGRGRVEEER